MLLKSFFGSLKRKVVVTGAGIDRIGLVKDITGIIFDEDGNISDSRMTKLEQNFAMMMLVEIPEQKYASFQEKIRMSKELFAIHLDVNDLHPIPQKTIPSNDYKVHIEAIGDDQPGLVYSLTQLLASLGGNIEKIDTFSYSAPMGGTTLFKIKARVLLSKLIDFERFKESLKTIESSLAVEMNIYKDGEESSSSSDG